MTRPSGPSRGGFSVESLRAPLALIGVFLPQRLVAWLPHATSVTGETVSLVLRFGVAWLIASTTWTVLTSLLGTYGRRPRHVDGDSTVEPA